MPAFFSHSTSRYLLLVSLLTGLSGTAFSQEHSVSLTLENCGQHLTFNEPPERVVTVGQATTEILYRLGLHDRVVGTSNWFTDVAPEFQQINANIERIADNFPSFESVVTKKPDLVTADFLFTVGPQGVVGKREQFHSLGINTYVMDSECINQDASQTSGSTAAFTLEHLYQSIHNLSILFGVRQRGDELIADIQHREAVAVTQAAGQKAQDLSAVFWFSSADLQMDPWVAGSRGVPAWMLSTLGIHNVIESQEEWPSVGWETLARANPDIIVIAEMTRRRFEADDHRQKLEFLRTDPVTRHMDAVIHDRIVIMDAHAMRATLRSIEGLELLSNALEQLDLPGK
jgi:iron complex transport system substrate-binding protein